MKKWATVLLTLTLLVGSVLTASAQYEGVINFTRTKGTKVTHFRYHVAGNLLRIEELDGAGKVKNIMLVDGDENTVVTLNTARKVWMDAYNNSNRRPVGSQVSETGNSKKLQGRKCTEYVVRNEGENTEVHYWLGGCLLYTSPSPRDA